jgi:hypothetical protein
MFFCNHLRRRALHKYRSKVPTAIIPIGKIHSATVLMDAADYTHEACTKAVQAYFKSKNIKVRIIYVYLEKYGKSDLPPADRNAILFKRDLNWFGRPSISKLSFISGPETDLFISLVEEKTYQAEFIATWFPARFKIGCHPFKVFDIVLDGREGQNRSQVFHSIEELFEKIR